MRAAIISGVPYEAPSMPAAEVYTRGAAALVDNAGRIARADCTPPTTSIEVA